MRVGVNPEKYKKEKNTHKFHRVIIVYYIPNKEEDYYSESISVLDACLKSLTNSINYDTTSITLINNNSIADTEPIVNNYLNKGLIDKYISFSENKGKVYAIMNEVRGIYEPFVTIADSDVLFIKGWEKAVFNIFKNFDKAGVVAPLPCSNLAFNHNNSFFFDAMLKASIKKGKVVTDRDCDIYLEGLGNNALLDRNNRKFNWRTHQYYLKKNNESAVIGAGHFVATYRTDLINNYKVFPEFKFFNGYEDKFIDNKADLKGYYRLSLSKTYAYHIGNKLDKNVNEFSKLKGELVELDNFKDINLKIKKRYSPFWFRLFFFKVIKKIMKL